jgi:flagellar protein FlgJ
MHNELSNAGMYTDMSGLAKLRAQASQKSPDANKEVARQFEALFIQTMLKAMREASQLSETTDGEQTRFYQDMYDKQIALDLARKDGIGLAAIIERQLGGPAAADAASLAQAVSPVQAVYPARAVSQAQAISPAQAVSQPQAPSQITQKSTQNTPARWMPASQEAFIQDLWPHAAISAKELGVPADVLIAQAALETGWGRKMIHDPQGGNAFNLFGIKADKHWQGEHVNVPTIEYRDGIAQREHASFRSYASLSESMDDYVAFLQQNPRYQQALEKAGNAQDFLMELQQAGYATDPAYAEKIYDIMNRDVFSKTVSELRLSAGFTKEPAG